MPLTKRALTPKPREGISTSRLTWFRRLSRSACHAYRAGDWDLRLIVTETGQTSSEDECELTYHFRQHPLVMTLDTVKIANPIVEPDNLRYTKLALSNGSAIPALGFGTLIPDPIATRHATKAA